MTPPAPTPGDAGSAALHEALRVSVRLLRGLMALLAVAYLASGLFVVRQHERALILHFGRLAGSGADAVRGPGLHWTWPRPLSEILRVPAERVQTLETASFWYAPAPGPEDAPAPATLTPDRDGYLVTGDANLLHSRWALRYTVPDPASYLFAVSDPDTLLRQELDRAVVQVSARFAVDRALRTDLEAYREEVVRVLRDRLANLHTGIRIQGVDLLTVAPPRQVADAFDAVTQSAQERAQLISDARAYAVRVVNEAAGESAQARARGATDRQQRVQQVQGRADAFGQLYAEWRRNPDVVTRTLWQDGLRRALAGVDQTYLLHARGEGQEIRLLIGQEE